MKHSQYSKWHFDEHIISFAKRHAVPFSRYAIAIVFFWFGILKVFTVSPATELVHNLFSSTIPFLSFDSFFLFFGILEVVIGIMFLVKGWERFAILLLFLHLVTTFLPLVIIPSATWHAFLVPTLEGQYIIKNLVIIACALGILAHLHPKSSSKTSKK